MAEQNRIIVKSYANIRNEWTTKTGSTLYPGECVQYETSGIAENATAGNKVFGIMVEDELQGMDITDVYAAGSKAIVWVPQKGDEGLVRLSVATGGTAITPAIGTALTTSTAGSFQAAGTNEVVALCMTAETAITAGNFKMVHVLFL